jgi:glyoxalase/bleomycin resistance protein/dioxygenase superfamily protein
VFLDNQYQLAYVTADFDAGVAILRDQFGITGFTGLEGGGFVERQVWTPDGEITIASRAAVAYVGDLSVEVFEPVPGATRVFTGMLTAEQPLRLHHVGMRCDDLDAMRAAHERHGRRAVMTGDVRVARFLYIDALDTLGHYLEYVSAPPEYWRRARAAREG